ncbi:MAG TPA: hypothetical protein VFV81_05425, partial [Verrucomicrobiae bacterium]|nr:hypothetical protein [Verrucomicrobiae bacterium]
MNLVPCLNRLKSPHRLRRHPMRTAPWMALAAFAAGLLAAGAQTVAFTNDPVATTYGGAADNPP